MTTFSLTAATTAEPESWLVDALADVETAVGRVVPSTYEAYARLLLPLDDGRGRFTKWHDAAHRAPPPPAQWDELATLIDPQLGTPRTGSIDELTAATLSHALRPHTSTPDDCFFAFWEGYGALSHMRTQPRCTFPPDRSMLVYAGTVEAAQATVGNEVWGLRAVRWWPSDHSWCVGADIYSNSLLVAGSTECIAALTANPTLEVELVTDPANLLSL